jgi:hypothetical protein
MFKVKVQGEYVARSGNSSKEKIKKRYEIEGKIPTINAALSVVKNKLLGPALAKKYPDYVIFLTYHIVEITPLDASAEQQMTKAEVSFMDRPTLIRYIKENALPVDAAYYPDLFKLREAVQYAKDDAEGYVKHFNAHKEDLAMDIAVQQANPDLFDEAPSTKDFVASVSNAKKPKASSPSDLKIKTEDRIAGLKHEQMRDGEIGPMDDEGL